MKTQIKDFGCTVALALTSTLLLTGCADKPKDPLSYLPESDVYIGVNMERLRESGIGKDLLTGEASEATAKLFSESSKHSYAGIDVAGGVSNVSFYWMLSGTTPTFATDVLAHLEKNGQRKKIAGIDAVTSSSAVTAAIKPDTLLISKSEANFETMVKASQAKATRAQDTKAWKLLEERFTSNSIVIAAAVAPLLARAEANPMVAQNLDPALLEAIREINAVAVCAEMGAEPYLEIFLSLPSQSSADAWKGRLALLLAAASLQPLPATQLDLVKRAANANMQAAADGLTINLKFSKEEIEGFLKSMEAVAAARRR